MPPICAVPRRRQFGLLFKATGVSIRVPETGLDVWPDQTCWRVCVPAVGADETARVCGQTELTTRAWRLGRVLVFERLGQRPGLGEILNGTSSSRAAGWVIKRG